MKQAWLVSNRDVTKLLSMIKFQARQLNIAGKLTKNIGQNNFGQNDIRRLDLKPFQRSIARGKYEITGVRSISTIKE